MPPIRADGIAVYVYRNVSRRPRRPRYEFLQIRRSANARSYHHSWQTVYGGVKKKETAIHAALRELQEETQLSPLRMFQVEYLESFYFKSEDYVLLMPVFAVEVSPSAKINLNHEHDAHRWIPASQIPKAFMWRTQQEALQHLLDHLHHGSPAAGFLEINPVESRRVAGKRRKSWGA